MESVIKIRHFTHTFLLTFLGPAQPDQQNDPIRRIEREYEERFGPTPVATLKAYPKKRSFNETPQNVY